MNRAFLVGRITQDPELRTTPNGIATTRIRVAINRPPNANGERVADFINVVVWRRAAENVAKYCAKGSLVGVEGRIQTSSYDGQDGVKHYVTEVVADNVTFLGSKSSATNGGNTNNYSYQSYSSVAQPVPPIENTPSPMEIPQDNVAFPTGVDSGPQTADISEEDPFKEFGSEVVLSDDDLPF